MEEPTDLEYENAKLRCRLKLYAKYISIMEHLHVFDGGIPLDDIKYNKDWLKRGNRSWLQSQREAIAKKIEDARTHTMELGLRTLFELM